MPWWLSLLIQLAIKIGLPELEKHVPASIAKLIEDILKSIKNSPNPTAEVQRILSVNQCSGIGCPPSLKNEV